MKRKRAWIVSILILAALLLPVRYEADDGGSVLYEAVLWNATRYHRLQSAGERIYEIGWRLEVLGLEFFRRTHEVRLADAQ